MLLPSAIHSIYARAVYISGRETWYKCKGMLIPCSPIA